jgi:SAM-dependent methyltransferase
MDRDRYSHIAHRALAFANPIPAGSIDRAIELAGLKAGHTVLDIGCGKAELLIRVAKRHGARGVGVERSALMFAEARARMLGREDGMLLTVYRGDAREVLADLEPASFDLACCIGSSHALGNASAALIAMAGLTKSGGHLLLGEGYWKTPPSAAYLAALGGSESDMTTHAGNVNLGTGLGLVPAWAITASDRDWDEYEWAYARGIEDFVGANPQDPDAAAMLDRSRSWRRTYLDHGRGTLGFGLYLFRKP